MRFAKTYALSLLAAASVSGCISTNTAMFVTHTSLGLDADTKPATASISSDRIEGYFGPRYENGAVPPVVASIKSDGKIFNPRIRQIYATGAAAQNLVGPDGTNEAAPQELSGKKKLMFFGTTTTTGLKIGFLPNMPIPDSFLFGFKRKELSIIPLGSRPSSSGGTEDVYPAVLAAIDTTATASGSSSDTALVTHQFFATGTAATELGKDRGLRVQMRTQAKDAFDVYEDATREQQAEALVALRCFNNIRNDQLPDVWADAHRHGLLYDGDNRLAVLTSSYQEANKAMTGAALDKQLRFLRTQFAGDIGRVDGSTPSRLPLLMAHQLYLCDLARRNLQ